MKHPALLLAFLTAAAAGPTEKVDFRWSPPEWQATICRPDDPQKTLVDKSGELLYGYCGGSAPSTSIRSDFRTRIGVVVDDKAVWKKQELLNPRVPIVRTCRSAPGLEIVEEAFGVMTPPPFLRTDGSETMANFAKPPQGVDPSLGTIALHRGGNLGFSLAGREATVALALCEGWWKENGKRVQRLTVEGAEPRTVDTVKDIGLNKAAAYWFDARDTDGDGAITITVSAVGEDKNTMLNGLWSFPAGTKPDSAALLAGKLSSKSFIGSANASSVRPDLILTHVTNTGAEPREIRPKLAIDLLRGAAQPVAFIQGKTGPEGTGLTIPAGKTVSFHAQHGGDPLTLEQAVKERENTIRYWENHPILPYGAVEIPDPGIQALVDASIRNIWQAREIKGGKTAFQVGPTCYRGLWIVDGAFILEAATMLGAGQQARDGVAYELTFIQPDGSVKVMNHFPKENGIVLWTLYRHALLTGDKEWLQSVWPKIEGIAAHIAKLRKETLTDDSPLNDGLMPKSSPDGGQGGVQHEYTTVFWNLVGMDSVVKAARWLGKDADAVRWQKEQDDFMATFRRAAARDMKTDPHGNKYLPNLMSGADTPQRAQWSFCHGVYPGQLFAKDDPMVMGNLAMLEATEKENMVYGTGWDAHGIWNYFGSFYGHAWLQQGHGTKAAKALYAMANHAAPILAWREEQNLTGQKYVKVGDMPHNWASAEFIRLAIHLLALDRGDELHLLEGIPAEWLKPGMVTRLKGIATPFGKLTMELRCADDGKSARLRVEPLGDAASCRKIVVHLNGTIELDPKRANDRVIPLPSLPAVSDAAAGDAWKVPDAKEKFHVFLLMGQSNMYGSAPVLEEDRTPVPQVLKVPTLGEMKWEPAAHSLHNRPPWENFGLGLPFAIEYRKQHPDAVVGLIPVALGGSPINGLHKGSAVYADALKKARWAMERGTIKGVLWHQGESDTAKAGDAAAYGGKLRQLIADVRSDLGNAELPFIVGNLAEFYGTGPGHNQPDRVRQIAQVRAALRSTAEEVPFTGFVESAGCSSIDKHMVHFDRQSYILLGQRYAQAIEKVASGKQKATKN